ncbi:hypothetical protein B0H94_110110 [Salsuginibacillus halophilus]|uniref:Uncharacterized protein n=1 Tax=Salsuginibacillus halophilus TaxID=517424 RepID=A0A2P8HBN9_9BACI|nr:hypothetical protein [Salsuginibacillus halophilus]PSL43634.1 hypothetical protein B0H94_110110 [Salsuginibacillus halophilus]
MAAFLLSLVMVFGVLTLFSAFLTLVTWPRRHELNAKPLKLLIAAGTVFIFAVVGLFFTADPYEMEVTGEMTPPSSVDTIEEEVAFHLEEERNSPTGDNIEVMDLNLEDADQGVNIALTLEADDNVTTDLLRAGTHITSARLMQRLAEIDEAEDIQLTWEFFVEPDQEASFYQEMMYLEMHQENIQTQNWAQVDSEDVPEVVDAYEEDPAFLEED